MAKGILAILGKPKEEEESDGFGDEDLSKEAKRQAARELSRAVKDGDPDSISDAFQRMYDLCAERSGEDYEDEE